MSQILYEAYPKKKKKSVVYLNLTGHAILYMATLYLKHHWKSGRFA